MVSRTRFNTPTATRSLRLNVPWMARWTPRASDRVVRVRAPLDIGRAARRARFAFRAIRNLLLKSETLTSRRKKYQESSVTAHVTSVDAMWSRAGEAQPSDRTSQKLHRWRNASVTRPRH